MSLKEYTRWRVRHSQTSQGVYERVVPSDRLIGDQKGWDRVSDTPGRELRFVHRFFAGVLDVIAYGVLTLIWFAVFTEIAHRFFLDETSTRETEVLVTAVAALSGWFAIAVVAETLFLVFFDRTPGKYPNGMVVVDAQPKFAFISWKQALARTGTKAAVLYGLGVYAPVLPNLGNAISTPLWINVLIVAVLLIPILGVFRKDRRGVHDLVAGTKVVRF